MPDMQVYIWITDAAKTYGRSRAWLDASPDIPKYKFPGDVKVYLKRAEVEQVLNTPSQVRGSQPQAG